MHTHSICLPDNAICCVMHYRGEPTLVFFYIFFYISMEILSNSNIPFNYFYFYQILYYFYNTLIFVKQHANLSSITTIFISPNFTIKPTHLLIAMNTDVWSSSTNWSRTEQRFLLLRTLMTDTCMLTTLLPIFKQDIRLVTLVLLHNDVLIQVTNFILMTNY